jgi:hypothetical protein
MAKASTISVMINKDLVNRLKSTMDENERLHKENLLLLKENRQLHRENEDMVIKLARYENNSPKSIKHDIYLGNSAIVGIGIKDPQSGTTTVAPGAPAFPSGGSGGSNIIALGGEQWQTEDEQPTEDWSMDED